MVRCAVYIVAGLLVLISTGHLIAVDRHKGVGPVTGIFKAIGKSKSYVKNAKVEPITFYAQEREGSRRFIERPGVLVTRPNAKATVLVCHGYTCNKTDVMFMRSCMFGKYNCLFFDFRAHGERTDGQLCTFGKNESCDVIGAVRFLKSRSELKNLPLLAYGFSMGSVAAIEAQAREGNLFDAMTLDCPYDSSENVIRRGLEKIKFDVGGYEFGVPFRDYLQRYAFHPYAQPVLKALLKFMCNMDATYVNTEFCSVAPVESVQKVSVPCFFIHCKNDSKLSREAVEAVFTKAPGYKRLWLTNGRKHCDSFFYNPEKYVHKVNRFFDDYLNNKLEHKQYQAKIIKDPDVQNMYAFMQTYFAAWCNGCEQLIRTDVT